MKKFLFKIISLFVIGCLSINFVACGSSSESSSDSSSKGPISISLSINNLELDKGETYQLYPTISPSTANQSVVYSSVNENCATVNTQGLITAIDKGNTVIRVETVNGLIATCNVEVFIAVGSVSGCMTYTNSVGTLSTYPDSGACVQLIPADIESFPNNYTVQYSYEEYGIYQTKTDSLGNYKLTNIPVGKYRLIYSSINAKWDTATYLDNYNNKEKLLKKIYGEYIGDYVIQFGNPTYIDNTCFYLAYGSEILITKDSDTNKSITAYNWWEIR